MKSPHPFRYAFADGSFVTSSDLPAPKALERIEARDGRVVPPAEVLHASTINDADGPKRAWLARMQRWKKPSDVRATKGAV